MLCYKRRARLSFKYNNICCFSKNYRMVLQLFKPILKLRHSLSRVPFHFYEASTNAKIPLFPLHIYYHLMILEKYHYKYQDLYFFAPLQLYYLVLNNQNYSF